MLSVFNVEKEFEYWPKQRAPDKFFIGAEKSLAMAVASAPKVQRVKKMLRVGRMHDFLLSQIRLLLKNFCIGMPSKKRLAGHWFFAGRLDNL